MRRISLMMAAVLMTAGPAWAQQGRIGVTAQVQPQRAYLGDMIVLKVSVEGIPDPAPPEVPSTADYEVRYYGGAQTSSSTFVFNGRTIRSSATTTFTYTLLPKRAGQIIIPAITVTHQGRQYSSESVLLEIVEPAQQDYVFLEVTTDREEYWIEQPITLEVAVWLRKLELDGKPLDVDPLLLRDPPELDIGWLDALEGTETTGQVELLEDYYARNNPGFAVNDLTTSRGLLFDFDRQLARFMFPRRQAERTGLDGREREYFVYRFRKTYLPVEAGPLTFSPVRFKGSVPVQVTSDMRIRRTERVLAFSQPVVVNVKPVPAEGRPDSYCGAVGPVRIDVSARPTEVNVGDPITLTMRLSGRARLESVGAPSLLNNEKFTSEFKVPEDPLGGVMEGQTKVFTQTVRARSDEVTEIPPIEVSYFDPDAGEFKTVRSRPIPLEVHPASLVDTDDVIGFGDEVAALKLTTLTGGIQANVTDADELLAVQDLGLAWKLAAGPVAGPVLFCLVWLFKVRRDRLTGDVAYARKRRAYRNALRKLSAAAGTDGASDAIAACLLDYMADRTNRGGGSVTRQEATEILRGAGVEDGLLRQFDELLERCELSRYARVDGGSEELADAARKCLREIEKCRF